jgi:hypothetical protein
MPLDIGKARAKMTVTDRYQPPSASEKKAPVIVLRRPDDDEFATSIQVKHWLRGQDESGRETSIAIPCGKVVGEPCTPCDLKADALRTSSLATLPKDVKDFVEGTSSFEIQVIDMRDHVGAIHRVQQAQQTGNAEAYAQALGELHELILAERVKLWPVSRTVYNLIMSGLDSFTRENGGAFRDPTDAAGASLLWVEKQRAGRGGFDRIAVSWGWTSWFPLPAALFADERVKPYSALNAGFAEQVAAWPPERVLEALAANEEAVTCLGLGVSQPKTIAPRARPALPPTGRPPVPGPMGFTPETQHPFSGPPPAAIPAQFNVIPQPQAQPSGEPKCFGGSPNLASATCAGCPVVSDCLAAVQKKMARQTAPAMAPAMVPPTMMGPGSPPKATTAGGPPLSEAAAKRRQAVAAALAKVHEAESEDGQ